MIKKINNNNNNLKIPYRHLLDRVAFYGRTLSEYLMMFGIDDIDHLKTYNTILDCPSGTSSFVAESTTIMELTRLAVILYLIWILPYCKKRRGRHRICCKPGITFSRSL